MIGKRKTEYRTQIEQSLQYETNLYNHPTNLRASEISGSSSWIEQIGRPRNGLRQTVEKAIVVGFEGREAKGTTSSLLTRSCVPAFAASSSLIFGLYSN